MWSEVGLCLVAWLVICMIHLTMKWRNPKCNGVLPPGSMGLPLIGETLSLIIPSYSLDLHPFIKKRIQRYGSIFRTSVAGRSVVISADPEINSFLIQQDGKSVELWYMDSFSKAFNHDGENATNAAGNTHKYLRTIFWNHFGAERLKEKLLPEIEEYVTKCLCSWSNQESVEVKRAGANMVLNFTAKYMIGYDAEKSTEDLSENCSKILACVMSFPLNVPGTAFYTCMQQSKKVANMLSGMLNERRQNSLPEMQRGDFLDQIAQDIGKESFLTENFGVHVVFGGLFASFEAVPSALALAFNLLGEHPSALEELTAEHEAIIKNREDPNSPITWNEYKSMNFTLQVINETLRLANVVPGLMRKTMKDISVKGFTIPKGWAVLMVTPARHLDPNIFGDPMKFNPWRWKDIDSQTASKNFMPFGGGMRQCSGSEYTKAFMSVFFHHLVTKYSWTTIKGPRIVRNPVLGFGDGIQIKFSEKKSDVFAETHAMLKIAS